MKTQYYTACSLDGFIATDDHSLEWLFPLGDINDTSYPTFIQGVGALAMGSSTYEWMLRHVVKPGAAGQAPWPYEQPTWVFSSRQLPRVPAAAIHFVQGDIKPVHQAMVEAAGGRNVWLVGGGELVGQFYDAGLLDEIIAQVGSVTLCSGKPLLPRRIVSPPLKLTATRFVGPGFAELTYSVPNKRDTPHSQASDCDLAKGATATVIPCLRYRDAPAAIGWLCETFGFERRLVVPGENGTVAHAQLSFGNGMIMLGSATDSEFGRLMKQPDEIGGSETQCAYVIVSDADAIYAKAKAAGARIAIDIKDEDYGGRGFSCYDPEGHLWNFGTYDPW